MPLPLRRQKRCKSGLISHGGPSPDYCEPCLEGSDWSAGLPVAHCGLWPLPSSAPAALGFAVRSGGTPRARSVHASSPCVHATPRILLLNPQAKKDASRFLALVLIGVAAAFCAGFNPHVTKPRVASKLAETVHADVCPPHWLPVHLAARPSHIDSPAPRFDEEALPFEDDNELLSMKRRMTETACVPMADVWECYKMCNNRHYDNDEKGTARQSVPPLTLCVLRLAALDAPDLLKSGLPGGEGSNLLR